MQYQGEVKGGAGLSIKVWTVIGIVVIEIVLACLALEMILASAPDQGRIILRTSAYLQMVFSILGELAGSIVALLAVYFFLTAVGTELSDEGYRAGAATLVSVVAMGTIVGALVTVLSIVTAGDAQPAADLGAYVENIKQLLGPEVQAIRANLSHGFLLVAPIGFSVAYTRAGGKDALVSVVCGACLEGFLLASLLVGRLLSQV